jgi:hypothetical protein
VLIAFMGAFVGSATGVAIALTLKARRQERELRDAIAVRDAYRAKYPDTIAEWRDGGLNGDE